MGKWIIFILGWINILILPILNFWVEFGYCDNIKLIWFPCFKYWQFNILSQKWPSHENAQQEWPFDPTHTFTQRCCDELKHKADRQHHTHTAAHISRWSPGCAAEAADSDESALPGNYKIPPGTDIKTCFFVLLNWTAKKQRISSHYCLKWMGVITPAPLSSAGVMNCYTVSLGQEPRRESLAPGPLFCQDIIRFPSMTNTVYREKMKWLEEELGEFL